MLAHLIALPVPARSGLHRAANTAEAISKSWRAKAITHRTLLEFRSAGSPSFVFLFGFGLFVIRGMSRRLFVSLIRRDLGVNTDPRLPVISTLACLFLWRCLIRVLLLLAENVEDLIYRVGLLLRVRLLALIGIGILLP